MSQLTSAQLWPAPNASWALKQVAATLLLGDILISMTVAKVTFNSYQLPPMALLARQFELTQSGAEFAVEHRLN